MSLESLALRIVELEDQVRWLTRSDRDSDRYFVSVESDGEVFIRTGCRDGSLSSFFRGKIEPQKQDLLTWVQAVNNSSRSAVIVVHSDTLTEILRLQGHHDCPRRRGDDCVVHPKSEGWSCMEQPDPNR